MGEKLGAPIKEIGLTGVQLGGALILADRLQGMPLLFFDVA